jgi:hypothetical protein
MHGPRPQPQGRGGDDAKGPLRTDEQTGEVVAGDTFHCAPPGAQDAPVGEHGLDAEHRIPCDAVFHTTQAAGVGRDVSSDSRRFKAARVRRIHQSVLRCGAVEIGVDHAGLGDGVVVARCEFADLGHPGGAHDQASVHRGRTAGQAGAGAAWDDGRARRVCPSHGVGDVVGASGHQHRDGCPRRDGVGFVTPISLDEVGIGDDPAAGQALGQLVDVTGRGHDEGAGWADCAASATRRRCMIRRALATPASWPIRTSGCS